MWAQSGVKLIYSFLKFYFKTILNLKKAITPKYTNEQKKSLYVINEFIFSMVNQNNSLRSSQIAN